SLTTPTDIDETPHTTAALENLPRAAQAGCNLTQRRAHRKESDGIEDRPPHGFPHPRCRDGQAYPRRASPLLRVRLTTACGRPLEHRDVGSWRRPDGRVRRPVQTDGRHPEARGPSGKAGIMSEECPTVRQHSERSRKA